MGQAQEKEEQNKSDSPPECDASGEDYGSLQRVSNHLEVDVAIVAGDEGGEFLLCSPALTYGVALPSLGTDAPVHLGAYDYESFFESSEPELLDEIVVLGSRSFDWNLYGSEGPPSPAGELIVANHTDEIISISMDSATSGSVLGYVDRGQLDHSIFIPLGLVQLFSKWITGPATNQELSNIFLVIEKDLPFLWDLYGTGAGPDLNHSVLELHNDSSSVWASIVDNSPLQHSSGSGSGTNAGAVKQFSIPNGAHTMRFRNVQTGEERSFAVTINDGDLLRVWLTDASIEHEIVPASGQLAVFFSFEDRVISPESPGGFAPRSVWGEVGVKSPGDLYFRTASIEPPVEATASTILAIFDQLPPASDYSAIAVVLDMARGLSYRGLAEQVEVMSARQSPLTLFLESLEAPPVTAYVELNAPNPAESWMSLTYWGAQFDYESEDRWRLFYTGGYLRFGFVSAGGQEFAFQAAGSDLDGETSTTVDIYIDSSLFASRLGFAREWLWHIIPADRISAGYHEVRLVLRGSAPLLIRGAELRSLG